MAQLAEDPGANVLASSRLTYLGAMGGLLAHEIAQPVTAGVQYLHMASDMAASGEDPGELRAVLDQAAEQLARIGRVVGWMQRFARSGRPECSKHSLGDLVRRAFASLSVDASRCELVVDITADADALMVDGLQFEHVLRNLFANACDAMKACPTRRIELTARRTGREVGICIADTGPGIAETYLPRVFDPLFTTKKEGLGLGLSLSRSIVEIHGGEIRAGSAEGGGAMFTLRMPAAAQPDPLRGATEAAKRNRDLTGGRDT